MFEKKERLGLTVYLHYNRDARKLSHYGDITYHSRKLRYAIVYVDQENAAQIQEKLKKEKYVKKVQPSYIKDLDQQFVGSLYRQD